MSERLLSLKYILLAVLLGILSCYLYLQMDIQPLMAQGDHGRDLYVFDRTVQGDQVYADYWWVYGPAMPHYYAFFMDKLGTTVPSVIIGQQVLVLISALFFYLILCRISSPITAALGSLCYVILRQEFFYTYNHTGGVMLSIVMIFYLLRYIQSRNLHNALYALIAIFLLGLVKLNFAATALATLIGTMILTHWFIKDDEKPHPIAFYVLSLIGIPFLLGLVYYLLLMGQPEYVIRQCFPYLAEDHPHHATLGFTISMFFKLYKPIVMGHWSKILFTGLSILSIVVGLATLVRKARLTVPRVQLSIFLAVMLGYTFLNAHEYLVSGVFYRTYWTQPMALLFILACFAICAENYSRVIKYLLYSVLTIVLLTHSVRTILAIQKIKVRDNYFVLDRAKVFLPKQAKWIHTVELTNHYLNMHMTEKDTLFTLPYDPLYNYILGKPSPSRQLIFFEHINIPTEQELAVIKEIEDKKTNWILLSSRIRSTERGLGEFGKDYCPLIHEYIHKNFEPVIEFGDWVNESGWTDPHGTRIYRRINVEKNPDTANN